MDPDGHTFEYDNVDHEDAPEDGEVFEDEIVFQQDAPEENLNDGLMFQEETAVADTAPPNLPTPVSPSEQRQHNKIIYICMTGCMVILTVLAVVLTMQLKTEEELGTSISQKEQLITLLTSRGVSFEDLLRKISTVEGQALAFLTEEDWDGDMAWLYNDIDKNSRKIIERYVLALIYFECDGAEWFHEYNFLSAQDQCEWNTIFPNNGDATIEGVTSCSDDGYVERLYFPINNLRCQNGLPDEMRHLTNLEALVVRGNEIEGNFPFFLRELTNLSVLSFGYNKMDGTLPTWIGEMTELSVLHLSDNTFVGTVPKSLEELTGLQYLGLDDNFLSGNVNDFLPQLINLEWLYMEDNQFIGTLDWLNRLELLGYLDVSNNNLDGLLPEDLLVHPKLAIMDLHGNRFSGTLPEVSRQNAHLQLLSVHSNILTGAIPESLSSIRDLTMLDLSFNDFTGTIPALQGTNRLRFLMTSGNNFNQQELPYLAELTSLVELSMKGNKIIGTIPMWLGELTNMKWLDLDANLMFGTVPSEIGKMTDLYALMLNRNDLDGSLPTELAGLAQLEVLLIDGNAIIGETSELCARQDKIDFFISDCGSASQGQPPQIDCPCCSTCCVSGDISCSDLEWTSVHDPIVENDFSRGYSFNYSDASQLFSKAYDVDP